MTSRVYNVVIALTWFVSRSHCRYIKFQDSWLKKAPQGTLNPVETLAVFLLSSNLVGGRLPWRFHAAQNNQLQHTSTASLRPSSNDRKKGGVNSVGRRETLGLVGFASAAVTATPDSALATMEQQLAAADQLLFSWQARTIGDRVMSGGFLPLNVGFGTALIPPLDTEGMVMLALQNGYRLIDTAQRYENEEGVGKALRAAISQGMMSRNDVFVITKVWVDNMGYEKTLVSVGESSAKLGSLEGGIDLVLIHWPGEFVRRGDSYAENNAKKLRKETWRALEKLQTEGVVKHIGVSNFGVRHLKELMEYAKIPPWVNQFEVHPYNQRTELVNLCQSEGIAVNAYSPLGGRGNANQVTDELLVDPVLERIGFTYGKTPPEVILRWLLQRSITPIPRSSSRGHMRENLYVFDFELTNQEMDEIAKLDRKQFVVYDADEFV